MEKCNRKCKGQCKLSSEKNKIPIFIIGYTAIRLIDINDRTIVCIAVKSCVVSQTRYNNSRKNYPSYSLDTRDDNLYYPLDGQFDAT